MSEQSTEKLKTLTLEEAEVELMNLVYCASLFLEKLEFAGKVRGNCHHAAQNIAKFAATELKNRWIDNVICAKNQEKNS